MISNDGVGVPNAVSYSSVQRFALFLSSTSVMNDYGRFDLIYTSASSLRNILLNRVNSEEKIVISSARLIEIIQTNKKMSN